MLRIGVTAGFIYPDPQRSFFSKKSLSFLENDTAALIARNGFLPILIPDVPRKLLQDYLENIDGLVLQGGSDVSPESYGADYLDRERWPGDRYRDEFEFQLLDCAMEARIPIFGVCRGIQILNAYFGGTLYQDIPTETQSPVTHANRPIYDQNFHEVEFSDDAYLRDFYRKREKVISIHHQAVKKVAPPFRVEARAVGDDLVEAISWREMQEHYILAVQWHPEFSSTLQGLVCNPDPMIQDFFVSCRRFANSSRKMTIEPLES